MQPYTVANLESDQVTGCIQTTIPSLPLELEECIIDYLRDDKSALSACALVCRSWIARAQSHIFHEVCLDDSCAQEFVQALETSPHIARYVMACQLKAMGSWCQHLEVVVPMLENVQQLEISVFKTNMATIALLTEMFSSITSLCLRSCLFMTAHETFAFLDAFGQLDRLEIYHSRVNWALAHTVATPGPGLHLSYLKLCSCFDMLPWIMVDYAVAHVDTVWISFWGFDSHIAKIINKLGHSMSHLEIHPISSGIMVGSPNDIHYLSIAPCTSLRTLTFEEPWLYFSSLYVITLLSQITSSVVEKISFRIGYNDPRDLNTFPLEKIEEILTGPLFSSLQTVVFNLYGGATRSGADDIPPIRIRMKLLDSRGVLQFVVMTQYVS